MEGSPVNGETAVRHALTAHDLLRQPGLNILHILLFSCSVVLHNIHAYTHSLQIEHLTFGRLLCLPWEVGGEGNNSGVFSDSKTSPTSNVLPVLHVYSVFLLTQAGREFVQR